MLIFLMNLFFLLLWENSWPSNWFDIVTQEKKTLIKPAMYYFVDKKDRLLNVWLQWRHDYQESLQAP